MDPRWKAFVIGLAASVVAVACGWWIANGEFMWPAVIGTVGGAATVVAVMGLPLDVALLGLLLVGYIIGNRGFAQLLLFPGLPLLPGEAVLALCGAWACIAAALTKRLPIERDLLNLAIAAWIAITSIRIVPDLREYGAMALRDYATVYYAFFFFIAQAQVRAGAHRRFLGRCLLFATVAAIPLSELFRRFPEFFVTQLTVRGVPLIYFKGDLIATFMAIGSIFSHRRWERTRRPIWMILALLGMVAVLLSENRASMLGLLVATAWLALRGHWGLLRTQLTAGFCAMLIVLGAMVLGAMTTQQNFLTQIVERAVSITDFNRQRAYSTAELESKGDNNQFRLVWWRTVIDETIDTDPWFGLGFGHDLAAGFLRVYYPDNEDEFATRSPHSILVTIFGRTGAAGAAAFLFVVFVIGQRTHRALRNRDIRDEGVSYWLSAWVILISACFGVVLEGPMGAVVFWTLLGMANGLAHGSPENEGDDGKSAGSLNAPAEAAELAAST
jgi:hypothetical protein